MTVRWTGPRRSAGGSVALNLCNTTRFFLAASYGQIYPELARLEPQAVLVKGWPPNTVVATRFVGQATTRDGEPYGNEGMQFLRLRWGRVVEDYICRCLAERPGRTP